ncbi:sodium:proton antiporter [Eisenbergiella sp.]
MKNMLNKKTGSLLIATIAALAGMIVYIITSVTGYLAASAFNPWPIVCTAASIILLAVIIFLNRRLQAGITDVLVILASILLLVSFYFFVLSRVQLAADVYFIPVNYPASEASALHISIVGVALYLIADIAVITAAFAGKPVQE